MVVLVLVLGSSSTILGGLDDSCSYGRPDSFLWVRERVFLW